MNANFASAGGDIVYIYFAVRKRNQKGEINRHSVNRLEELIAIAIYHINYIKNFDQTPIILVAQSQQQSKTLTILHETNKQINNSPHLTSTKRTQSHSQTGTKRQNIIAFESRCG